jgi:hypothetical protein
MQFGLYCRDTAGPCSKSKSCYKKEYAGGDPVSPQWVIFFKKSIVQWIGFIEGSPKMPSFNQIYIF